MKKFLTLLIVLYQNILSPFTPTCRYEPSCSEYTKQAIDKFGATKGFWLGLKRFSSCHPCSGKGYYDPVD